MVCKYKSVVGKSIFSSSFSLRSSPLLFILPFLLSSKSVFVALFLAAFHTSLFNFRLT